MARRLLVAGAREVGAAGGLHRGRGRGQALAGFAFAGLGFDLVLGGHAAADLDVIDVDQFVLVLADQLIGGEDEDVIAAFRGVGEEGWFFALAGRDQVEAAAVLGVEVQEPVPLASHS